MDGTGVGVGASTGAGTGGFLSSLMSGISGLGSSVSGFAKENPEMLAMMLDMIGSKMAPGSPAAGLGTMMGKSQLAGGAEQEEQARSSQMFGQLISALTGKDQPGPTELSVSSDPTGTGGLQYSVKGYEQGQQRLDKAAEPAVKSSEDFLKDFGG